VEPTTRDLNWVVRVEEIRDKIIVLLLEVQGDHNREVENAVGVHNPNK